MSQEPDLNHAKNQANNREWEKLRPALKKPASLSPGQAQRSSNPLPQGQQKLAADPAPWTSPLPQVANAPTHRAPAASSPAPGPEAAEAPVEQTDSLQAQARKTRQLDSQKPSLLMLRRLIITLAVPIITFMLAIRAVASSAFLWVEYHRPGFPADTYGFDTTERMRLGSYGLDYILNLAPESYLSQIQTAGVNAFLPHEVGHMSDVKRVLLYALVFAGFTLIAAFFCARGLSREQPGTVRTSLFAGGWLTLVLLVALGVAGLLGWDAFFTSFHQIFFPQGNWQFRMSDTLIRLYPPQFWVDAAITAGLMVLLITLALLSRTWPTARRRQQALKRRAENQKA